MEHVEMEFQLCRNAKRGHGIYERATEHSYWWSAVEVSTIRSAQVMAIHTSISVCYTIHTTMYVYITI